MRPKPVVTHNQTIKYMNLVHGMWTKYGKMAERLKALAWKAGVL